MAFENVLPPAYEWLLRMPLPKTINEGVMLLSQGAEPEDWVKMVCEMAGKIVIDREPIEAAGNVLIVVDETTVDNPEGKTLVQRRAPHTLNARRLKRGRKFDPKLVGEEPNEAVLGDIVLAGKVHGFYLGQDKTHFHVLTQKGVERAPMAHATLRRPPYTPDANGKPIMPFTAVSYALDKDGNRIEG